MKLKFFVAPGSSPPSLVCGETPGILNLFTFIIMSVRSPHDQQDNSHYFVTFTCYQWLPLFQIADAYSCVYKWFDSLYEKEIRVTAYVIMPNHIHVLICFPKMKQSLNIVIGNAKRFMAYEIIRKLKEKKDHEILGKLAAGVNNREKKKGQLHKVFEESFEAKECHSAKFIFQKFCRPGVFTTKPRVWRDPGILNFCFKTILSDSSSKNPARANLHFQSIKLSSV